MDTESPLTQNNADPMISIRRCIYTHIGTFQIPMIPATLNTKGAAITTLLLPVVRKSWSNHPI